MNHSDIKKLLPIQSLVQGELESLETRLQKIIDSDVPLIENICAYLNDPLVITPADPVAAIALLLVPQDFHRAGSFHGFIVQDPPEDERGSRTVQGEVPDRNFDGGFFHIIVKMHRGFCNLRAKLCPFGFRISPGIHDFYSTAAGTVCALNPVVAGEPGGYADLALVT